MFKSIETISTVSRVDSAIASNSGKYIITKSFKLITGTKHNDIINVVAYLSGVKVFNEDVEMIDGVVHLGNEKFFKEFPLAKNSLWQFQLQCENNTSLAFECDVGTLENEDDYIGEDSFRTFETKDKQYTVHVEFGNLCL